MLNESYFRLNEYLSDGEYKLYEVDSQRDDMGFRFQADHKSSDRTELILGAESRLGRVDATDTYFTSSDILSNKGSLDIFALFAQYRYRFRNTKWELITGLRYDVARFYKGSFSVEHPSYSIEYFAAYQFNHLDDQYWSALSPKFTLHVQPNPRLGMFFTLSKGFRAPILDDLCRAERSRYGLRVANQKLRPEHIYSVELGVDKTMFSFLTLEVSSYYTAGYDFMNLLSTGDSVNLGYTLAPIYAMSNISKVNILGFEGDLSARITNRFHVWCNYTFIRAAIAEYTKNSEADRDLKGKFLTNIPAHSWVAGGSLKTSVVNAAISGKFTGERWINEDNSFDNIYLNADRYKSYFSADVKIWRSIAAFECSLDVNNVFNVVYINSKGYKSPGRMVFLKLTYRFANRESR
jgi:iron complex outermembrane receptor protein